MSQSNHQFKALLSFDEEDYFVLVFPKKDGLLLRDIEDGTEWEYSFEAVSLLPVRTMPDMLWMTILFDYASFNGAKFISLCGKVDNETQDGFLLLRRLYHRYLTDHPFDRRTQQLQRDKKHLSDALDLLAVWGILSRKEYEEKCAIVEDF